MFLKVVYSGAGSLPPAHSQKSQPDRDLHYVISWPLVVAGGITFKYFQYIALAKQKSCLPYILFTLRILVLILFVCLTLVCVHKCLSLNLVILICSVMHAIQSVCIWIYTSQDAELSQTLVGSSYIFILLTFNQLNIIYLRLVIIICSS